MLKSTKKSYIGMLLLDKLQETGHIRSSKMVNSLQTSENGRL